MSGLQQYYRGETLEAGCDEAGRGCLAGPVFAAAVILPAGFDHPFLNDSKKMSEKHRELLRPIIEREATAWYVASVDPERIDRINILRASFEAMAIAAAALDPAPGLLLIDGNRFGSALEIPHVCIVKGDATYRSIAAASILAKTHRDEYMSQIAVQYPHYQWNDNKGYPTAFHRQAIHLHGLTPHHRRTFGPCRGPELF